MTDPSIYYKLLCLLMLHNISLHYRLLRHFIACILNPKLCLSCPRLIIMMTFLWVLTFHLANVSRSINLWHFHCIHSHKPEFRGKGKKQCRTDFAVIL